MGGACSGTGRVQNSPNDDRFGLQMTIGNVRKHINVGFTRRQQAAVQAVFQKYQTEQLINAESIKKAFEELDVNFSDEDFKSLVATLDIKNDRFNLSQFMEATKTPSVISGWVKSMPLSDMLVDCLRRPVEVANPLLVLSSMNESDIAVIVQGFSEGVTRMLSDSINELRMVFEAMKKKQEIKKPWTSTKFEVKDMKGGDIADFQKGIEGRIGSPHMDFDAGMKAEHCSKVGWNKEFKTDNYRIETTPRKEWEILMKVHAPDVDDMRYNRRIPDIDVLVQLEVAKKSNLKREEVIALVLYTGPMYHIYNTILRRWPEELFNFFNDGHNLFSTTIFVLASAVQKMSRMTELPKSLHLYRGLGGTTRMPQSFYRRDENGCTGFAEFGFMSTTADKQVAVKYSGVDASKPLPMVMVIRVGAVDRGACIQDFSQYVDEVEYLWVPSSFVELDGTKYLQVTPDGIVEMLPVKVSPNLKTMTTDELVQRKKTMHISALSYRIDEINAALHDPELKKRAEERLLKDSTVGEYTVEDLITKILAQCQEVLKRHDDLDPEVYVSDNVFRGLVLEMVELKAMALSKILEWIENETSSFLRFRFPAELRKVHRRRIAYIQRSIESDAAGEKHKYEASVTWCQLKGLIQERVGETNELQETALMVAAADGRSITELQFLVRAGAEVNGTRPADGVTALWLAAQFGHGHCIQGLIELRADVNQAANDGATPVYIAAQSGFEQCIQILAAYGADIGKADKKGTTPMHQAAMNGHCACILALLKLRAAPDPVDLAGKKPYDLATDQGCKKLMDELKVKRIQTAAAGGRRKKDPRWLIVSSGDVSDVDGFLALAEYSKTGADVLFVMNYPAYVKETGNDTRYSDEKPGLGYKYGAREVLSACKWTPEEGEHQARYDAFLQRYDDVEDVGERVKAGMTDLAYWMAKEVWQQELPTGDQEKRPRGSLMFCIGGVNAINPFSPTAVKNELSVYAPLLSVQECESLARLTPEEGLIYDSQYKQMQLDYEQYTDVLLDFNGSMAFLNDKWAETLNRTVVLKLRGVFVMGGVYADAPPLTMPAIPNVLNRFSSATMNQLYHPHGTAQLFRILGHNPHIPVYTVSNNVVEDLKTIEAVDRFLQVNALDSDFIRTIVKAHYLSKYKPPKKAFDFYAAFALRAFLNTSLQLQEDDQKRSLLQLPHLPKQIFFSVEYGLTLIANTGQNWQATLDSYVSRIDTDFREEDSEFVKTKKAMFVKEIGIMRTLQNPHFFDVRDLRFTLNEDTKRLDIRGTEESNTLTIS